jgi:hypothetical protein
VYPVRIRKLASTGNKTASLYKTPSNPVRPKTVKTIGKIGVKQHSAARSVPPSPNVNSLLFIVLVHKSIAHSSRADGHTRSKRARRKKAFNTQMC